MTKTTSADSQLFDPNLVRLRRDRAATAILNGSHDDFLYRLIADSALDRLADISRKFPRVLVIDGRDGQLLRDLQAAGHGSQSAVCTERSARFAEHLDQETNAKVLFQDSELLDFPEKSFDLVIACGGLHSVNDLPGILSQITRVLVPDGLFLGTLIAGESLRAIREQVMEVEDALRGGMSPRFAPIIELADAAGLLQRAGFALPVADRERFTVDYASPLKLFHDLRAMGETNVLSRQSRSIPPKALFPVALSQAMGEAEKLLVIFELLFLSGWRPDRSKQQQPLQPGSGAVSLTEALIGEASPPKSAD